MACDDCENLFEDKINTIEMKTLAIICASEEFAVEVNTEKTKYIC
jgi:hypothetical protein